MKGVKLSQTIDYLAMEDDEGSVGVMVFRGNDRYPSRCASVEDRDEFRAAYDEFRTYEDYA
tara:strand:- start:251 stop:433 length:183 start_codon:yes stop_codon:yes gene_type:complete